MLLFSFGNYIHSTVANLVNLFSLGLDHVMLYREPTARTCCVRFAIAFGVSASNFDRGFS